MTEPSDTPIVVLPNGNAYLADKIKGVAALDASEYHPARVVVTHMSHDVLPCESMEHAQVVRDAIIAMWKTALTLMQTQHGLSYGVYSDEGDTFDDFLRSEK